MLIRNVFARGKGSCLIHGHPDSPLENITLENVRLSISHDPEAHPRRSIDAITVENARNFRLKDFEIIWDAPHSQDWQSALLAQNVKDLTLDGFSAGQAPNGSNAPAVVFKDVNGALVQHCRSQAGTGTFLHVTGEGARDIVLWGNDFRLAQTPLDVSASVEQDAIRQGW
jgi:hypothetical protein